MQEAHKPQQKIVFDNTIAGIHFGQMQGTRPKTSSLVSWDNMLHPDIHISFLVFICPIYLRLHENTCPFTIVHGDWHFAVSWESFPNEDKNVPTTNTSTTACLTTLGANHGIVLVFSKYSAVSNIFKWRNHYDCQRIRPKSELIDNWGISPWIKWA